MNVIRFSMDDKTEVFLLFRGRHWAGVVLNKINKRQYNTKNGKKYQYLSEFLRLLNILYVTVVCNVK